MVGVGLETDRCARGESGVLSPAFEIRRGRNYRAHAKAVRPAKIGLAAEDIGLAQNPRVTLVVGIAAAERQADLRCHVIRKVAEDGPGLGIDIAGGGGGQAGQPGQCRVQPDVEHVLGVGIEIISAEHAGERAAIDDQLELLAELAVVVDGRNVDIDRGQRVEIDRGLAAVLTIGGDGAELEPVVETDFAVQRDAAAPDVLLGIVKRALAVKHIFQDRRTAEQAGD